MVMITMVINMGMITLVMFTVVMIMMVVTVTITMVVVTVTITTVIITINSCTSATLITILIFTIITMSGMFLLGRSSFKNTWLSSEKHAIIKG